MLSVYGVDPLCVAGCAGSRVSPGEERRIQSVRGGPEASGAAGGGYVRDVFVSRGVSSVACGANVDTRWCG